MELEYRKLKTDDASTYQALRLEALNTFPGNYANSYETEEKEHIGFFTDVIENAVVDGVFKGEEMIACSVFFIMWPHHPKETHKGMVAGMYVKPAYQGQGIAKKMMERVFETASTRCKQLHLALYSSNVGAYAMYKNLGFKEYGREPDGLCVNGEYFDKVWMCKKLNEPS